MKNLTIAVGALVVGIVFCFGMSVRRAVLDRGERERQSVITIPTPAVLPSR